MNKSKYSNIFEVLKKFDGNEFVITNTNYDSRDYIFEEEKLSHINKIIKTIIYDLKAIVNNKNHWQDIASDLYQLNKILNNKIYISDYINDNLIRIHNFHELIFNNNNIGNFIISDKKFELIDKIFKLELKNSKTKKIADPWFYKKTKYKKYKTFDQKLFVDKIYRSPEGSTTLLVMPTGSGKSITGLTRTFLEENKLTIVIMPTISLTIDQSISYDKFFKDNEVISYYSQKNSVSLKRKIIKSINNQELRLLYISPEAILNQSFEKPIIKAAEAGYLTTLVIDECHLITSWGSFFRTEFQLLSIFRKKILNYNNKIRTYLLSATINKNDLFTLKKLFVNNNCFIELRGDDLRKEIIFDHIFTSDNKSKINTIINKFPYLPKPLIIYTHTPNDAEKIYNYIESKIGYKKMVTFTGETNSKNRMKIIQKWNNNEIDTIIATSAFGMGVDKPNVRTVLHTYVPSSIKDYYQEVGRGGRDGIEFLALSIICPSIDFTITGNTNLTSDRFMERLNAILESGVKVDSDKYWITTQSVPIDMFSNYSGKMNESWNDYIIMLLQKYGIIDILNYSYNSNNKREYKIKIKKYKLINSLMSRKNIISSIIDDEKKLSNKQINNILGYFKSVNNQCFGEILSEEFIKTNYYCNSCVYCRKEMNYSKKIQNTPKYTIQSNKSVDHLIDKSYENVIGYICNNENESLEVIKEISEKYNFIYFNNIGQLNYKKLIDLELKNKIIIEKNKKFLEILLKEPRVVVFEIGDQNISYYYKLKKKYDNIFFILLLDRNQNGKYKSKLKDEIEIEYIWR